MSDKSMGEHEPSAWGEQRFGLEKLWIVAILAVGLAMLGGLLWLAAQG